MKGLVNGQWQPNAAADDLQPSGSFRNRVSDDPRFPPESGRYHLYVSYACPWAHRTIIYRRLKRLENVIGMSVVHPRWGGEHGWCFRAEDGATTDPVNDFRYLYQVYQEADTDFTGRVTVPVLWDRVERTIVNNESADIIRMFDSAFSGLGNADAPVFRPDHLSGAIDELNAEILSGLCSGVYRAGFASTQQRYEQAVREVFSTLDALETRMSDGSRFLHGDTITESDWHFFATACRFDVVYHSVLKCNLRRLVDYPALTRLTKRLYQVPGVAEVTRLDHVKMHYYDALGIGNPSIVAIGPEHDFRNAA